MTDTANYPGRADISAGASDFNQNAFHIDQALGKLWTGRLVLVKAVDTTKLTVDVQPLVSMIDVAGNASPHGVILGLTYQRVQGGTAAILVDPAVGDLGWCVFADRDSSSAKAKKGVAAPGSRRRFDPQDGHYLLSIASLAGVPTRVVDLRGPGITITDPASVTINAPSITLNGATATTGDVVINGKSFLGHHHGGVQTGTSQTLTPT
ncbi:MAG: hypothetical protein ACYDD1_02275 [Caulobacteraceae bacterium]